MRKLVSLALSFLLMTAVAAQAEGLSVVVFDMQKVAAESEPMAEAKVALDNKFGAQRDQLEKERNVLEKKTEELMKKKPTQQQQADLFKEQRTYQEKAQAFIQVLQADEMRVREDIYYVVDSASKQLAEEKGYDLILDIAATPYYSPKLDITADMLTKVNDVWKSSKTTPAATDKK